PELMPAVATCRKSFDSRGSTDQALRNFATEKASWFGAEIALLDQFAMSLRWARHSGGTMKRWVGLSVLVVLTLAALTPLAYATPPDQTWIAGLYDNADYDDVVALVTSTASVEKRAAATRAPDLVGVGPLRTQLAPPPGKPSVGDSITFRLTEIP